MPPHQIQHDVAVARMHVRWKRCGEYQVKRLIEAENTPFSHRGSLRAIHLVEELDIVMVEPRVVQVLLEKPHKGLVNIHTVVAFDLDVVRLDGPGEAISATHVQDRKVIGGILANRL